MTTKQKIQRIEKSIELQRRIRETVAATQIENVPVEIIDIERTLATIDEVILMLESRLGQIHRRSAVAA